MTTIRPPRADELAAVQAVGVAAGERFSTVEDPRIAKHAGDPPMATDELAAALGEDRLLVAVEGDRVVGFVLLEEVDGRGHVEEVSVHPGGQGAGVGTALLEAARAWAAAAGLDGVTLTTFADVPWNRPWYERRGYRVLGPAALTPGLAAKVADEAAHGLLPELRVAMWRPPALDPAGLAVLLARLADVAEDGLAVLRRSASSPNIKERADCSTALFTPDGELLAQSESIPVHLGSMPASVHAVIERLGELDEGEQAVVNDPYEGGTHLNDVTVVAPVRQDGRLVGWVANRAHHADIGGAAPGSIPADATHIAQEGIRLPPVRLTDEVRDVFLAASRTPDERAGDLAAQAGANRVMARRLGEVVAEGWPLAEVLDYGERRMRAALGDLPDGSWRFTDVLDSTGAGPGQREPATIAVTVTVAGDAVTFDFEGTDRQGGGNVNAVEAVTVSAVAFALRATTEHDIPANGGAMRPVRVLAPTGSLVAAEFPAAVGAGNVEVSQRVADVCFGALAQVAPERVGGADQGTMNNLLVGGDGWVYYETVAGGQGARPSRAGQPPRPGQSGIQTGMTNTRNTPVEALERSFPMRVLRYRLRSGSGGVGQAAGGDGIERDLLVLEDATVSLITERRASRPWGLAGGGAGESGENWLLPQGDEARAEPLPDKCTVHLRAGDVLRMRSPGGGGWGTAGPG
jgi:N-methylhydantoinase B/oxoprolinase/acetone carboxylase alpha subunit/ribosomal protein S18 acetylase RimI-like enzyme